MELFKLFGTIAIDNSEANRGIDETTDKAEKSHPKISAAFEKIGSAAVKVGKVMATGLAAGAAAVGALAKQSLDSYAEYEQLVGGVETLFGTRGAKTVEEYAELVGESVDYVSAEFEMLQVAQTTAMNNAAKAYQTAGMSANEYMETISGFAASLKQSTASELEAAEVADMAVQDMADNANKMGTSMASIQNAYQGFAKQNYTMLDNLKLGYGGTKEEMERLLKDASKLSGIKYDIGNLSDVYSAIHVIQDELGITGTTAREASQTISGSLAATKSAWQNLLTGFADGNQDLSLLIGNLVSSATTAANNIVPRIVQILSGISDALPQVMTVISAELPGMLEALLPGLIDGAVALAVGLAQMVPSLLEMVFIDLPYLLSDALYNSSSPAISSLGNLFLDIGEFWREVLLPAISGVGEALGGLWNAVQPILAIFPQLFAETTGITNGFDIFRNICWAVEAALQIVANKITEVANWISEHSEQIKGAIRKCWEDVQSVWNSVGQPVFDLIQDCIGIVRDVFAEFMPEIQEFVQECFEDISDFWEDHLKPCFEAIGDFIENTLAPIFEEIFESKIRTIISNTFDFIKDIWNNTLKPVFIGITDFLTGVFTGNWKKAFEGLVSIVKGVFNGILSGVERMANGVINALNGLINGINQIISKAGSVLGLTVSIPTIPRVSLPRLEEGGILEKGQVGLLEGSGAEAVVPLDRNQAWIRAVAQDMKVAGIGGGNNQEIHELKEAFQGFVKDLPEMLLDAFASMKFDVNNREFARMVKAVN